MMTTAGVLLSSFSRLFTGWLQSYGFTCGMEDIVLVPEANHLRNKMLSASEKAAREVSGCAYTYHMGVYRRSYVWVELKRTPMGASIPTAKGS
jgi:hypothetical protein